LKPHMIALAFALIANAAANVMIKAGMRSQEVDLGEPVAAMKMMITNPLVIGGVILFAMNVVSYAYVLTRVPLSLAYPIMTSGGFLIVVTASAILLRESLSVPQLFGIALIIGGVILVASQMD
jgi:multidrug transporter EmrE-like cation transporter